MSGLRQRAERELHDREARERVHQASEEARREDVKRNQLPFAVTALAEFAECDVSADSLEGYSTSGSVNQWRVTIDGFRLRVITVGTPPAKVEVRIEQEHEDCIHLRKINRPYELLGEWFG